MLVKCIGNALEHLKSANAKKAYQRDIHLDIVDIDIGVIYCVYGIVFRKGDDFPWYLISEDDHCDYPTPNISEFFEIIDGHIPTEWVFTSSQNGIGDYSLLPKRWANDRAFLEKLLDGQEDDVAFFNQLRETYKNSM